MSQQPQNTAKQEELLSIIADVPGVSRLAPSYREMLSTPARALQHLRNHSPATGIDVVTRGNTTVVYIDCCTDGSHPADQIVDTIHQTVIHCFTATPEIHIRILSLT